MSPCWRPVACSLRGVWRCVHRVALLWLWLAEGSRRTTWDLTGASVALLGMAITMKGAVQPPVDPG